MKQKLFTLLLAVAASIGTMFATVYGGVQIGNLYYNLNDKNFQAEVTSKNDQLHGYSSSLTITSASIPSSVSYWGKTYNVVAIGANAFCGCTRLTSVTIPSSVTSIGIGAFDGCSGLTSVTIPNSVTSIGTSAFYGCSGLTSVTIPNSVTSIGSSAFYGCSSLTSVTIPNSVTEMGTNVFEGCSSLPIENNIRYAGSYLVEAVNKTLSSYTIKSGTKWIGSSAFRNCSNLNSITIPSSVKVIQYDAFKDCTGLTSVTIPNSVTDIYDQAFRGCISLSSVTIPNSITTINFMTFRGCIGLTSVTIPNSVTSIGDWAFADCTGLISVEIPNSVTSFGMGTFNWVRNIVYTGSSNWGSEGALSLNGFVDGYMVYKDATKTELLGCSSAVNGEVIIPNSVTNIGNNAFYGCNGITSVTIPNSVTSIGEDAFYGCSSLTSVVWNAKNCADFIGSNTPFYRFNNFDLRSQITSFTFGDGVEHIPTFLCSGMPNLTSVTIPNSVTSIGNSAFSGCSGLTSMTIPNSVTSIGNNAFQSCTGLTSVTIPNSVTSIGNNAFSGCSGLTSVTIGNSVNNIGDQAFYSCTGLTSVTIPNSVTSIGNSAFSGCSGLTSVTIPNSVTSIGGSAFENSGVETINFIGSIEDWCNKIWSPSCISSNYQLLFNGVIQKNVIIPSSVTSIGNNVFRGCTGLTSVTIPNSVTSIGQNAFYSCTGLTSVTIPNSVTSIGGSAFAYCSGLTSVTCLATTPPVMGYIVFNEVDCSNIPLYVPMESVSLYQATNDWKEFNVIGVMFADEVETAVFAATPTDDFGVILEWQAVENATLYNIEIKQGNNIVRQLQFDSNGKLLNSPSNAPSRYPNIHHASTAILSGNGWRCEVNDLDPGTNYTYSITVKAENGSVLYSQSIGFTTKEETFIIKFVNWNGEELLVLPEVVKGTTPSYTGETPVRPNTTEYTYTFAGWDPAIVAVTGDVTYTATFTATKNSYTITWQNEDGSLIDQTTVEYGQIPAHAEPTKEATAEYTYTFAGWTPAVVAVTGDATYKATFTATKNSYTITWQDENGSLIDQTTVEYGIVPTHADPIKQNTAEYTYTFAGWTPAIVAVTGDVTYTATFTATKNSYTITWQNEDGSLIDQTTVEYGVVPTHAEPTKEATEEYTYKFAGWTPAVVAVTGDATYKATFSSVVNVYTISVSAVNGHVIGGGEYQYGATIDLTAIPNEGYVFDQWSDGVKDNPRTITVTGDAEYTALFTLTDGFENIYTSEPVQKVIIDQKVNILRGEKVYTVTGQEVK